MTGADRLILRDARGARLDLRLDAGARLELAIEDPDGDLGTFQLDVDDLHALATWLARQAVVLAGLTAAPPRP
jgi:hypothetical protein